MVRHEAQHQKTCCGCEALLGWEIADLSPISRCKIPVDKKAQVLCSPCAANPSTTNASPCRRTPVPASTLPRLANGGIYLNASPCWPKQRLPHSSRNTRQRPPTAHPRLAPADAPFQTSWPRSMCNLA
ncbi:unnamed protein product [Boreogadus saida]